MNLLELFGTHIAFEVLGALCQTPHQFLQLCQPHLQPGEYEERERERRQRETPDSLCIVCFDILVFGGFWISLDCLLLRTVWSTLPLFLFVTPDQ